MAVPKGAKVTNDEHKVVILFVTDPREGEKKLAEAEPEDEDQMAYVRNLADTFKDRGMEHRLVERTTKVRTQITEVDLT